MWGFCLGHVEFEMFMACGVAGCQEFRNLGLFEAQERKLNW